MNIEFKNGATVNRVWKAGEGELLAAFQYPGHAAAFARVMAADETQPRGVDFAMANHHDGKVTVYKQPESKPHPGTDDTNEHLFRSGESP